MQTLLLRTLDTQPSSYLLVENGLCLTTITLLLPVVTPLSLRKPRRLAGLILCDLVHGVLVALRGIAEGSLLLRYVHHLQVVRRQTIRSAAKHTTTRETEKMNFNIKYAYLSQPCTETTVFSQKTTKGSVCRVGVLIFWGWGKQTSIQPLLRYTQSTSSRACLSHAVTLHMYVTTLHI